MSRAYLGLGSNLGDRRTQLRAAVRALHERGVGVTRASSLYESEPMYELDQPRFLNGVLEVETELSPGELLRAIKEIELQLGRQPRQRNGPREIDIDVLAYEDVQMDTPELTIPHPRMSERPFVMAPLAELGAPIGLRPSGGPPKGKADPHPSPLPGGEREKVRPHRPPEDASPDAQHDPPASAFPARQREKMRLHGSLDAQDETADSPRPASRGEQVRDLYKIEGPEWAILPGGEDSSLRSE